VSVDVGRLPLEGVVASIDPPLDDGRVRVTFTRLASPYFVEADAPERDALLAALRRSLELGEPVTLSWALPRKSLALAAR
jgi:hypothetical protein